MTDDIDSEATVGYGKPPRDGQFASGHSGNPRGRPKGAKNKTTILREIASEEHRVTIGGEAKPVKTIDLFFMRLRELAMKGDEKALDAFNAWTAKLEQEAETTWSCGLLVGEGYYGDDSPLQLESVEE